MKKYSLMLPVFLLFAYAHAQNALNKGKYYLPKNDQNYALPNEVPCEPSGAEAPLPRSTPMSSMIHSTKIGSANAVSPVPIGSSSNVFTTLLTQQNQVSASDSTDCVFFVHRNNASTFGGSSGHLRYDISIDGGTSWHNDVGLMNPLMNLPARYPSMGIFNPLGNTNPLNSLVVYSAPTLSNSLWDGDVNGVTSVHTSGPIATANEHYSFQPDTAYLPTSLVRKSDSCFFAVARGMSDSNHYDTSIWVICGDIQINDRYERMYFNIDLPCAVADGGKRPGTPRGGPGNTGNPMIEPPAVSFSPNNPNLGWIATLMANGCDTDSVYVPVFVATSDGGMTWGNPMMVDLGAIPWLHDSLRTLWVDSLGNPISDGKATTGFDFDLTVDVNGNPHMAVVVGSRVPGNPFAFASGLAKFLIDLHSTDGGLTWDADYVSPILAFRTQSFGATASTVSMDNYPQISRSEDGRYIFYSWADSDTALVTGNQNGIGFGNSQNTAPNLRIAGLEVATGARTYPKLITDGDLIWEGKVLFPTMAPSVLHDGNCWKLPIVVAEMPAGEPIDPAYFHYFGNDAVICLSDFCDPNNMTLAWSAFGYTGANPPCTVGIEPTVDQFIQLADPRPNPSNDRCYMAFRLPSTMTVALALRDMSGREVMSWGAKAYSAGENTVEVNTSALASGTYLFTLTTDDVFISKRLVVTR